MSVKAVSLYRLQTLKLPKPSARAVAISGRPFGSEVPERPFPLFGCLCHALEKDRPAL
jgi:hypothetical protein